MRLISCLKEPKIIRTSALVLAAAAASTMLITPSGVASAATSTIADWQMNETSRPTMVDSSGNKLNGVIGSNVAIGQSTNNGSSAYGFSGDWRIVTDERLVTVADSPLLDPGTGTYAVTLRFRTGSPDSNIIQKGQAGQTGGYWKVEVHQGWPMCHFRDGSGNTKAIGLKNSTDPSIRVDDSSWHTLRCERSATGVRITLDAGTPQAASRFLKGTVGKIDNTRPVSIGGKLDCDGISVGCDYYFGAIDWVRIERP